MYSMILMTAMAGSPQTPEFNGFFRDLLSFRGCHGSCTGSRSATGGCTGSRAASTGCTGDRPARAYAGGSCYGSCSGRASFGSCCGGGVAYSSCTGSTMPPAYAAPEPALYSGDCCGSSGPANPTYPTTPQIFPEDGGGYAKPEAAPPSSIRLPSETRFRPVAEGEPGDGDGAAAGRRHALRRGPPAEPDVRRPRVRDAPAANIRGLPVHVPGRVRPRRGDDHAVQDRERAGRRAGRGRLRRRPRRARRHRAPADAGRDPDRNADRRRDASGRPDRSRAAAPLAAPAVPAATPRSGHD